MFYNVFNVLGSVSHSAVHWDIAFLSTHQCVKNIIRHTNYFCDLLFSVCYLNALGGIPKSA